MNKILTDALNHFGIELPPPPTEEQLDTEFHLIIKNKDSELARLEGYTLRQLRNKEHLDEWNKLQVETSKKLIHDVDREISIHGEYKI
jgi:hypothetical protein